MTFQGCIAAASGEGTGVARAKRLPTALDENRAGERMMGVASVAHDDATR